MNDVKAAVMTAPMKMRTERFPVPDISADSALVRMLGSAICGTDKHMYSGQTNLGLPGAVVSFPVIPGHENLGVIERIGPKAAEWMRTSGGMLKEGERVAISADIVCGHCYYCRNIYGYPWCLNHRSYGDVISCNQAPHLFGGWAEKMYVLPGTFMFRVPSVLNDEEAVLAEQMAVAYGAFGRAFQSPNAKEGYSPADTVVIQGVGPLGICNVFMAKMLGASKIIVIDKSEYRLNLTHQLCNTDSISVKDFPKIADRVGRIMELTDNLGADLVVECTGAPDILAEGLEMIRLGGTYLVEGAFVEEEPTKISASRIVSKNARIIGAAGMPYQAYGRVLEMMAAFKDLIPFDKAVTHQFGVDAAEEALKKSMSPDSMKVVVTSKLN
ncbi:MAG TPA: zinc-binding dehydrogenase [Candidatus Acidoferrum sp.]|nr:zinc-binding dehydrogenase [Candidatus Acidoferrum sp.]